MDESKRVSFTWQLRLFITAAITMNVDVEDAILEHVEAGGQ